MRIVQNLSMGLASLALLAGCHSVPVEEQTEPAGSDLCEQMNSLVYLEDIQENAKLPGLPTPIELNRANIFGAMVALDKTWEETATVQELVSPFLDAYGECLTPEVIAYLEQVVVATVDDQSWVPEGYQLIGSNVAGKIVDHTIDCTDCGGLTWEVISRDACPGGLYVEGNFVDSNGVVVDWSNDTIPSLGAMEKGLIEILTYSKVPNLTIQLVQVLCNR